MIDRTTKLRWRRRVRQRRRQVEDIGIQAEEQLEEHFFKRLSRLTDVRRFVVSWVLLVTLLIIGSVTQLRGLSQYYQKLAPAPGGTYTEGVIGSFTTANPLYATTAADAAAARLVFSGLFKYDQNNQLTGDLAKRLDVDERGNRFTITLRDNVKWHDGHPLTSADVLYTYKIIQNPDAKSPLFNSWKGITVEAPTEKTIVFTLPNVLASFPTGLTNGIVPKHLLESTQPGQLRTIRFNTMAPVGSGPFRWEALEVAGETQENREERIGLIPNELYYHGVPQLDHFILRTFRSEEQMLDSFRGGELTAMSGLTSLPDNVRSSETIEHNIPLTGEVMVFFKNTIEPFNDPIVRKALVLAVDVASATKDLEYPVILAKAPLLASQLGYDKTLTQLPYDTDTASKLLDASGWVKGPDGIRSKAGKVLSFQLSAQSTSEYTAVTGYLQKAWRDIGVDAQVMLQSDADVQGIVSRHDYEAVLYGISLGTDPDVFAYWHSSQADPRAPSRLNLSEYISTGADKALEAGRTRSDAAIRASKYRPFLEAWRSDAPALALYQPRFLYVTHGDVAGFAPKVLNTPTDRFNAIEGWTIRQQKVSK
ncbi:MAG TPA: peptide ABC transporter substrate-binding protein [Verrucomicrobiae bacterium]|nr:peptide ABC transporter substrate-binding protein [Verrucomicrobiae bacterium]